MIETMISGKKTIATALNSAVTTLSLNETIETPRLDAEVLLCSILGCERIYLVIEKDRVLSDTEIEKFEECILRRKNNEPVSYITGSREFMSLDFDVSDGILIPRPDTEVLVEEIIKMYKDKKVNILDLCTGSGAIAVSLAYYLKNATILAVDKYAVCVDTTRKNAIKHNVDDRVNVVTKDVLEELDFDTDFDCIISNPPYIKSDILTTLPPDVQNFEPLYALDGGDDGLIFYRKITEFAKNTLKKGGILAFEIGFDQGNEVRKIIENTGCFDDIRVIEDLAGLDRVVIAEKR